MVESPVVFEKQLGSGLLGFYLIVNHCWKSETFISEAPSQEGKSMILTLPGSGP